EDGCEVVSSKLVEAGRDAPEVLQLVEEALDEIALAIDRVGAGAVNEPAAEAWNMGSCSGLTDEIENGVAVIAAVGDNVASRHQIPQEFRHDALVVRLPCAQNDANRQTIVIYDRVD